MAVASIDNLQGKYHSTGSFRGFLKILKIAIDSESQPLELRLSEALPPTVIQWSI